MWSKSEYESHLTAEQLAEDRRRNEEQAMVLLLWLAASGSSTNSQDTQPRAQAATAGPAAPAKG